MANTHLVTRTLTESVMYPDHAPRKASAEYKRVHKHLIYELDEPCWICGIRRSTGGNMETHHWHLEWAMAQVDDPDSPITQLDVEAIFADFPEMKEATDEALRAWLDSEGNMLVLCDVHHRHGLQGIHMITYPAWAPQRYRKNHNIAE